MGQPSGSDWRDGNIGSRLALCVVYQSHPGQCQTYAAEPVTLQGHYHRVSTRLICSVRYLTRRIDGGLRRELSGGLGTSCEHVPSHAAVVARWLA